MTDAEKIGVLRRALFKIAYEAYDRDDECLTSTQPGMIWQLVAIKALDETKK